MEARRFEALARAVGTVGTRRAVLGVLGGSALGTSLGLGLGRGEDAQAGIPIVNCKIPGQKCNKDQKCCTTRCNTKKGRCQCQRRGKPCWSPLEGALCCSGRCAQGKCA